MSPSRSNILILLLSLTIQQVVTAFLATQAKRTTTTTATTRSTRLAFSLDHGDPVLLLPLMEAQLLATSNATNQELLEQSIEDAKMAAEFSVRRAQVEFYEAFASQSIELMTQVWSRCYHCRCVHPGSPACDGREAVLFSWSKIFESAEAFHVEANPGAHIDICGNTATCTCVQQMNGGGEMEVVNIFKREHGNWRITLHMSSLIVR